jgi:hypothetical protein
MLPDESPANSKLSCCLIETILRVWLWNSHSFDIVTVSDYTDMLIISILPFSLPRNTLYGYVLQVKIAVG